MKYPITGILCLLVIFFPDTLHTQSWLDNAWQFRNPVTIDNQTNPSGLTDHTVRIALGKQSFNFSNILPTGADIRFTDTDGTTLLQYFLETISYPDTAVIWVKIPTVAAASKKTIYMYYGNSSALPVSSGKTTFPFYDGFEEFKVMNAPLPLNTPTYDGSGQMVHPDILFFEEGWNGYKYWMVMTPFPKNNDDYENPSLLVSQNGQDWSVPPGLTNPIVSIDTSRGYLDDPDVVMAGDTMVVYYNEVNKDGHSYIKRMYSLDGINWSTPRTTFIYTNYLTSPAIIYEDSTYYMWFIYSDGCYSTSSIIYLFKSKDGKNWTDDKEVNLALDGRVVWHFNIIKNGNKYQMLLNTFSGTSPDCARTNLYYAESTDKINWNVNSKAILTPTCSSWDSYNIYRASFLADSLNNLRIWYSARHTNRNWRLGYTEGNLETFLNPNQWTSRQGDSYASSIYRHNGTYSLKQLGCTTLPKLFKSTSGQKNYNVWLHDDLSSAGNQLALLRLYDNQNSPIGIGIWTDKTQTNYVYHLKNYQYYATSIPRSTGWHKLTITVTSASTRLYLDDILIAETPDMNESAIIRFSLEGLTSGEAYFDDCYVRESLSAEPVIAMGTAEGMIAVNLHAYLQGAYNSSAGEMSTSLNPYIPLSSPYLQAPCSVSVVPADAVDWILLEFRVPSTDTAAAYKSVFLKKDGQICDPSSAAVLYINLLPGNYYVIVRHRNHLAVMTSLPVSFYSGAPAFDFSSSGSTACGDNDMSRAEDDKYTIPSGDSNSDGYITGSDFNTLYSDFMNGSSGYLNTDFNMDGQVTGTDFNYFNLNYYLGLISVIHP
ncbi:MAG: DUF2341 domain-containing protein [Bacteroidota bacterium]